MKTPKLIALIFTFFLILFSAFYIFQKLSWNQTVTLSATVFSQDGYKEELFCWKDDTTVNDYYIFLPSYANLSESVIRTYNTMFCTVTLNGKEIDNELILNDLCLNVAYPLVYQYKGEHYNYSLTFVQSANIATMYIDTSSGNMDYIHETKGNKETGTAVIYTSEGKLDYIGVLDFIKGRGNSTWTAWPKKPYNIKFSQEADLLNMGSAQEWVLLAEYTDTSYMKNKIAYDVAKTVGLTYTPDCDWIDLYLNGKYAGLYLLCEHIDIHRERVNINNDNSFLVSIEGLGRLQAQNYPYIELTDDIALRIRHSEIPVEKLQSIWLSAQNAILSEDGIDPISLKNWQELIDLDSWVLRYLMDEIFANYDGGYISQYFYYDGNNSEKIFAGPVWDMDLTLGCYDFAWQTSSPYTILAGRPHMRLSTDTPLFSALCQKDTFNERLSILYKTTFLPVLSHLLDTEIKEYAKKIKSAAEMDCIVWHKNEYVSSIDFNIEYLKERIQFLNNLWIEKINFCFVQANASDDSVWGCFAVQPGNQLPELIEKEGWGWYHYGSNLPFDINQPIYNNISIYLAPLSDIHMQKNN